MEQEEIFDIINEQDDIVRQAKRSEVHGNPSLMHKSVHLLVFNDMGELYLQKRSLNKKVQPGKWDTSVGGHVESGESIDDALKRETMEELSISPGYFNFIYKYIMKNDYETELVHTYYTIYNGDIVPNKQEISDGRFFSEEKINDCLHTGNFTPNFVDEWKKVMELKKNGYNFLKYGDYNESKNY